MPKFNLAFLPFWPEAAEEVPMPKAEAQREHEEERWFLQREIQAQDHIERAQQQAWSLRSNLRGKMDQ